MSFHLAAIYPVQSTSSLRTLLSACCSGKKPSTMLYIIGLGLADEKDVSVKGLEIIRRAERVYLEAYTAVLLVDQQQLVRL